MKAREMWLTLTSIAVLAAVCSVGAAVASAVMMWPWRPLCAAGVAFVTLASIFGVFARSTKGGGTS